MTELLYDLGETEDLTEAMPEKVAELEKRLTDHLSEIGAKIPLSPEPPTSS